MVSETKLDDSFPEGQFLIKGFHLPFTFDRNRNGGGIVLYVREDTLAKFLSHNFPSAESFFIDINLHKKKWLINCSYNPHKSNIGKHLDIINTLLDTLSTKYENIVLTGDLMHVLMMRHFANFVLCMVSLNNLHALKSREP